jgi:hypothetical protein
MSSAAVSSEKSLSINHHNTSTKHQLPYFPIYYNDVYEVDLPPGHRFPMDKYRKVRLALQDKIMSIAGDNQKVHCGE